MTAKEKAQEQNRKEVEEMKSFILSAGCMTIEHISTAIRRSRNTNLKSDLRRCMDELKHYMDIFVEDFGLNFPKEKRTSNVHHKTD